MYGDALWRLKNFQEIEKQSKAQQQQQQHPLLLSAQQPRFATPMRPGAHSQESWADLPSTPIQDLSRTHESQSSPASSRRSLVSALNGEGENGNVC